MDLLIIAGLLLLVCLASDLAERLDGLFSVAAYLAILFLFCLALSALF